MKKIFGFLLLYEKCFVSYLIFSEKSLKKEIKMNIISNYDTSKIFERRTGEYIKEVLTSYSIGN